MTFVIICLDGFKREYLEKTKFLKKFAKENFVGDVHHGFGYASEFSAITGKDIEELGIIVNNFYYSPKGIKFYHFFRHLDKLPFNKILRLFLDLVYNSKEFLLGNNQPKSIFKIPLKFSKNFNFLMKKNFFSKDSLSYPTIFELLKHKKVSGYMWPFIYEHNHSRIDLLNLSKDTGNTDERAFRKSIKLLKKNPELCYIHFFSTDNLVHKYGTKSKETEQLIKNLDNYVAEISKYADKILIYSDHGMTDIKETINIKKIIDKTGLVHGRDYLMFLDATLSRFWCLNKSAKKQIKNQLQKIKKGRLIYFKNPKIHKKFGELIFQVNPGILILPNFYQDKPDKATHGYDEKSKDEKAFYIMTKKKGLKKTIKIKEIFKLIMNNI